MRRVWPGSVGERIAVAAPVALLLGALAAAALLAGCGERRQEVFAYQLPNFPLRNARPAGGAGLDPPVLPASGAYVSRTRGSRSGYSATRTGHLRSGYARRPEHRSARRRRWANSARLDLNRAPLARLEQVPGVGPALAARIVAARPFRAKRDLLRHGLLTPAEYAQAKGYLVVHRRPGG
ncbi:MAG: ComEA family DNA-binding protein [Terriglobales bacterium]